MPAEPVPLLSSVAQPALGGLQSPRRTASTIWDTLASGRLD
jgi:hypothetical protein